MHLDYDLPYLSIEAFLEMELQVYTHSDLGDQHEHDIGNEVGVDVLSELSAFVHVAKEVTDDGEERANGLYRDMPFRSYYLATC